MPSFFQSYHRTEIDSRASTVFALIVQGVRCLVVLVLAVYAYNVGTPTTIVGGLGTWCLVECVGFVRVLIQQQQAETTTASAYEFVYNPLFETAWNALPPEDQKYEVLHDTQLRYITRPEWQFASTTSTGQYGIAEGNIIFQRTISSYSYAADVLQGNAILYAIVDEFGLGGNPFVIFCAASAVGGESDAVKETNRMYEDPRLAQAKTYIITQSRYVQIGTQLAKAMNVASMKNWFVFDNADDAFHHVRRSILIPTTIKAVSEDAEPLATRMMSRINRWSAAETIQTTKETMPVARYEFDRANDMAQLSYHQQRIRQIFSILFRLSDTKDLAANEHELSVDEALFEVPPGDIYADVFDALKLVLKDKKQQILYIKQINKRLEDFNEELQVQYATIKHTNEELKIVVNELNDANAVKLSFLAIVSHDLKNPLSSIIGLSYLLEYQSATPEDFALYGGKIGELAQHMLGLVNKLLDSTEQKVNTRLNRDVINFSDNVLSIIEAMRITAELKQQTLQTSIEQDVLLMADATRLRQVVENLISNAIKFSPEGGNIYVSVVQEGESVRFVVRDEGLGLTDDDLEKMFVMFQRLSARPTAGESSHGVGLASVKQIVEAHSGMIKAESPGRHQGATFTVTLPITPPEAPPLSASPSVIMIQRDLQS